VRLAAAFAYETAPQSTQDGGLAQMAAVGALLAAPGFDLLT